MFFGPHRNVNTPWLDVFRTFRASPFRDSAADPNHRAYETPMRHKKHGVLPRITRALIPHRHRETVTVHAFRWDKQVSVPWRLSL